MPRPNITRFANLSIDPTLDPGNPYKTFRLPCLTQEEIDDIPAEGLLDGLMVYNTTDAVSQTYDTTTKKWMQASANESTGLHVPNLNTAQRNALLNVQNGTLIFHTDANDLEVYDNGQWYDVLDKSLPSFIAAGSIMMWGGDSPPPDWRECDGSELSRSDFIDLFNAIGTNWGVGDGVNTFNIPDLRGLFVRGKDGTASRDPDKLQRIANNGGASGNNVGSIQEDDFKSHNHSVPSRNSSIGSDTAAQEASDSGRKISTNDKGGNETRPKNAYVLYIIKTVGNVSTGANKKINNSINQVIPNDQSNNKKIELENVQHNANCNNSINNNPNNSTINFSTPESIAKKHSRIIKNVKLNKTTCQTKKTKNLSPINKNNNFLQLIKNYFKKITIFFNKLKK